MMAMIAAVSATATRVRADLVGEWNLNGNALDSSGNGNNGIITNAISTTDRFGNPNSALYFNGNAGISISNSSSLNISGVTGLTIAAWVCSTGSSGSNGNQASILNKWGPGSTEDDQFGLCLDGGSGVAVFGIQSYYDPQATIPGTQSLLSDNQWHFIVGTVDPVSRVATIYVDGVAQASKVQNKNTIQPTNQPVLIGRTCYSDGFFTGKIDDVQLYNAALSPQQIASLYTAPNPASPSPNVTWVTSSGSFETATNWQDANSNQRVPVSTDNLFFTSPSTYAISLSSPHTVQSATVSNGNVTLAGQTLTVSNNFAVNAPATLKVSGNLNVGSLSNSGTMISLGNVTATGAITNSGQLAVGGAISAQTFTQTPSGTMNYQIGPSGTGLISAGQANLAGSLNITFANGFQPASDATYQLLSSNSLTGTFNNGSPLLQAGSNSYQVTYGNSGVTLQPTDVITFYVESALAQGFGQGLYVPSGHVYLSISSGISTKFLGFVPMNRNPIETVAALQECEGKIQNESATPWSWSISYPISNSKFQAVTNVVNQDILMPPVYGLMGFNCVDWALKIAEVAGVQLPNARNGIFPVVSAPSILQTSLEQIGNNNTKYGGTVHQNGITPPTGTILPIDYDYLGLVQAAHGDPSDTANLLGVPLDKPSIQSLNANINTGLTLSLVGTDPVHDTISIDWGDGSPETNQFTALSHIYEPGSYTADLIIIDGGALHDYELSVSVTNNLGSSLAIDVAQFPKSLTSNVGVVPADILPVPEPGSIVFVSFAGLTLLWHHRRGRSSGVRF